MWYLIVVFLAFASLFLSSKAKIRYVFDRTWRIEMHFVFFSLHFSKGEKKTKRKRISGGNILRATRELLSSSTVVIDRLSIPTNVSPTVPGIKFLGINISYPLIYAYLTANSQRLIVSENAVIKESTENFKVLVDISLQTAVINLVRAIYTMLFTAKRRREA